MRTLTLLTETVAETVVEAIQKKAWTAFVNNAFAFSSVALNNRSLVEDFKAVEQDHTLLEKLKEDVLNHHKVKELGESKAGRIFDIIWMAMVYNSKAALEIADIVKE